MLLNMKQNLAAAWILFVIVGLLTLTLKQLPTYSLLQAFGISVFIVFILGSLCTAVVILTEDTK